jgi:hypothetical protein
MRAVVAVVCLSGPTHSTIPNSFYITYFFERIHKKDRYRSGFDGMELKIQTNQKETKTEELLYLKFHGSRNALVNKKPGHALAHLLVSKITY